MLNDEAQKIVLNTKGIMKDLSEELLEFLTYVEDSTDDIVKHAKGNLVKSIHKRVQGILLTKKVLKLSTGGYIISQIEIECNIS